jgi:CO dehydrogenase/acetyl-CoA synthase beta subunit
VQLLYVHKASFVNDVQRGEDDDDDEEEDEEEEEEGDEEEDDEEEDEEEQEQAAELGTKTIQVPAIFPKLGIVSLQTGTLYLGTLLL